MTAFNAILPLVAVLLGSLITYWVNVRTRARNKVDDAFREAIAAVAEADSRGSVDNFSWDGASEDESAKVLVQYRRDSMLKYVQALADARAAVARASVYDPTLAQYYRGGVTAFAEGPDKIIEHLRRHF